MTTLYNDNDPFVCAWLGELIAAGHLAPGHVERRSIAEIRAEECAPASHFFAGIGGWPLALRLAGWPDDRPVWTGSCPCQPFSCAGRGAGASDERHLWPQFLRLIALRRPPTIFGEQVASKLGREWLSGIRADLEKLGYAVGAADLCAAGVGAPHIRQRLFWVAKSRQQQPRRRDCESGIDIAENGKGPSNQLRGSGISHSAASGQADARRARLEVGCVESTREKCATAERGCEAGGVGNSKHTERGAINEHRENECSGQDIGRAQTHSQPGTYGQVCRMGDASADRCEVRPHIHGGLHGEGLSQGCDVGAWSNYEVIPCLDGKARRIESGTFPLAHGIPGRVGLLRGYGNAIVPQVAAEFVRAFLSIT